MVSLAAVGASPVSAATLKEAVTTTIAKHPVLQRDLALSRAADKGIDQANANFLPTIDVDSEAGYEYTNSPSTRSHSTKSPTDSSGVSRFRQDNNLTFRQMAFDGFLASNQVASARATYQGSRDAVIFSGELLGIRVVSLYIDEVLRNQEFVASTRKATSPSWTRSPARSAAWPRPAAAPTPMSTRPKAASRSAARRWSRTAAACAPRSRAMSSSWARSRAASPILACPSIAARRPRTRPCSRRSPTIPRPR